MAVSRDDVRHVAQLARLSVGDDRLDHLVAELNGILGHMDALSQVNTTEVERAGFEPVEGTPVRSDSSGPLRLQSPIETFAPSMKDGFFVVPRLASHGDDADRSP